MAGLVALFLGLRRRAAVAVEPALNDDEHARAAALLVNNSAAQR